MRFEMFKKSQAALEFLTTYGWAFLIILIMIGALAYFGILSPSKVLPNRCTFGAEFQCLDHQIDKSSEQLKVRLRHNLGESIEVDAADFTITEDDGTAISCTTDSLEINAWTSGKIQELSVSGCTTDWIAGEKVRVLVSLTYYTTASGLTWKKEVKGEIYSTVLT